MVRFRKEVATVRRLAPRTDELATAGPLPPVAVRREARQAVFERHGGPERGYVPCAWCGLKVHPNPANPGGFDALIPDPINAGAGFGVSNVLPACPGCFRARGEGGLRSAVFRLQAAVEQFANPWHDSRGRFTSPGSGTAVPTKGIDDAKMSAHLDGLVEKGVLTRAQADAVRDGLAKGVPTKPPVEPPKPPPKKRAARKPKTAPEDTPVNQTTPGTPEHAAVEQARLSADEASVALDNHSGVFRDANGEVTPETRATNAKVMKAGADVNAAAEMRLTQEQRDALTSGPRQKEIAEEMIRLRDQRYYSSQEAFMDYRKQTKGSIPLDRAARQKILDDHPVTGPLERRHRELDAELTGLRESYMGASLARQGHTDAVLKEIRPSIGTGEIKVIPGLDRRGNPQRGAAQKAKYVQEAARDVPKEWVDGMPPRLTVYSGVEGRKNVGGFYRGVGFAPQSASIHVAQSEKSSTGRHEAFHAMEAGNRNLYTSQAAYIAVNGSGPMQRGAVGSSNVTGEAGAFRRQYSGRLYSKDINKWQHFELGSTAMETGHGGDWAGSEQHRTWFVGTLVSA
jgi:hypothetical protein